MNGHSAMSVSANKTSVAQSASGRGTEKEYLSHGLIEQLKVSPNLNIKPKAATNEMWSFPLSLSSLNTTHNKT